MAYVITEQKHVGFDDGSSQAVVEVRCDTAADLPTPEDNWMVGSVAWVVSTGDIYGLTTAGSWVVQNGDA